MHKKIPLLVFLFFLSLSFLTHVYADSSVSFDDLDVKVDDSGNISGKWMEKVSEVSNKGGQTAFWNETFKKFKKIILGVNGLAMLGSVFFLIRYVVKLQASAENPQEAAHAKKAIFISMIATAVLGVSLGIVGYLWYLLK